jgi:tRNA1Val (adenine37-N6)-methyltransferase
MANSWFRFKQFTIHQDRCAMKVTTDACLFGAWAAEQILHADKPTAITAPRKILDIGTGSGLLALMLAQQTSHSIHALEIDQQAFEQARENIHASPWPARIALLHDDVRSFRAELRYDIIISNPPFYEKELKSGDARKNIAHHGENLALDDLFSRIKHLLAVDGEFYLLLPYKRLDELEGLFDKYEFALLKKILVRPITGHSSSRIMLAGQHKINISPQPFFEEISIKNESGEYSPRFIQLLQDYYLAF